MTSVQRARNSYARTRLARALAKQTQTQQLPDAAVQTGTFLIGTVSASYGSNLWQVTIGSSTFSYVPTVGNISLAVSTSTVVLCVKVGTQLIIVGQLFGNTASAPTSNVPHA